MESSEARRKRLKALTQSAADGGEGPGPTAGGAALANPFADEGKPATNSGPFNFYSDPVGAMQRSRDAQQQRRAAVASAAQDAAKSGRLAPAGPPLGQQWQAPPQRPAGMHLPPPQFQAAPPQHAHHPRPGPPRPWPGPPGQLAPPHMPGPWQQQQHALAGPPPGLAPPVGSPWQQHQRPLPPPGPYPGPPPHSQTPNPQQLQQQQHQGQFRARAPLPDQQQLYSGQPPPANQYGGRGGGGRGGRGGRGGGRGGGGTAGIDAYVNPSMTENPWAALERRVLGGTAASSSRGGLAVQHPPGGEEGRLSAEGAADRPWH